MVNIDRVVVRVMIYHTHHRTGRVMVNMNRVVVVACDESDDERHCEAYRRLGTLH